MHDHLRQKLYRRLRRKLQGHLRVRVQRDVRRILYGNLRLKLHSGLRWKLREEMQHLVQWGLCKDLYDRLLQLVLGLRKLV